MEHPFLPIWPMEGAVGMPGQLGVPHPHHPHLLPHHHLHLIHPPGGGHGGMGGLPFPIFSPHPPMPALIYHHPQQQHSPSSVIEELQPPPQSTPLGGSGSTSSSSAQHSPSASMMDSGQPDQGAMAWTAHLALDAALAPMMHPVGGEGGESTFVESNHASPHHYYNALPPQLAHHSHHQPPYAYFSNHHHQQPLSPTTTPESAVGHMTPSNGSSTPTMDSSTAAGAVGAAAVNGGGGGAEGTMTLHEVWQSNLEDEFVKLRDIIEEYPFVAMDTEFPGVVLTPVGQFRNKGDFNYQQVRVNVNCLKLIQVGFTFANENGELPPGCPVWQFNFHFNPAEDSISYESGELLREAGIDFTKHQSEGIAIADFGELLTTSGLLVDKRINWITFHSSFDFGYLIKSILLGELPSEQDEFFRYHRAFFPTSYDIKTLLRHQPNGPQAPAQKLKGGLQEVAKQLQVARIGQQHQAGSDSLLTAMTFFRLRDRLFSDRWAEVARSSQGQMFGLGDYSMNDSYYNSTQYLTTTTNNSSSATPQPLAAAVGAATTASGSEQSRRESSTASTSSSAADQQTAAASKEGSAGAD